MMQIRFLSEQTQDRLLGRESRALLRDVITPRHPRQFPGRAHSPVPRHGDLAASAAFWWGVAPGWWRGHCPAWGKPSDGLSAPGPWCCRAGGSGLTGAGLQGCLSSWDPQCAGRACFSGRPRLRRGGTWNTERRCGILHCFLGFGLFSK